MYGGGMDMGMGMGEEAGKLQQLIDKLPPWASALLTTLAVLAAGAVIGVLLGRLYASVRYPDPEKQTAIHPLVRVIFLCVLTLCAVTLYRTLTQSEAEIPHGEESSVGAEGDMDMASNGGGGTRGGVVMGQAGGYAVMVG